MVIEEGIYEAKREVKIPTPEGNKQQSQLCPEDLWSRRHWASPFSASKDAEVQKLKTRAPLWMGSPEGASYIKLKLPKACVFGLKVMENKSAVKVGQQESLVVRLGRRISKGDNHASIQFELTFPVWSKKYLNLRYLRGCGFEVPFLRLIEANDL